MITLQYVDIKKDTTTLANPAPKFKTIAIDKTEKEMRSENRGHIPVISFKKSLQNFPTISSDL